MALELEISATLTAANATHVGIGRNREALALEDVHAAALAPLIENPLGKMIEGMAVGVGGDVDNVAEEAGDAAESDGGFVRRATGRLVVEVPEDDDLLLAGGPDTVAAADHVNVGGGGGAVGRGIEGGAEIGDEAFGIGD